MKICFVSYFGYFNAMLYCVKTCGIICDNISNCSDYSDEMDYDPFENDILKTYSRETFIDFKVYIKQFHLS